jgi:hypothetical protein
MHLRELDREARSPTGSLTCPYHKPYRTQSAATKASFTWTLCCRVAPTLSYRQDPNSAKDLTGCLVSSRAIIRI